MVSTSSPQATEGASAPSQTPVLLQTLDDGILTLTFNRPERLNAFSPSLMRAFGQAVTEAANNDDVRVIVITGAGRGFCAGGDLGGGKQDSKASVSDSKPLDEKPLPKSADNLARRIDWLRSNMDAVRVLFETPKPSIAMIRGATISVGMGIAGACDFRMASETAHFATGFGKAGLSGDYGVSYFLTQVLGSAKTRELMLLGDRINAEEALTMGFVREVTVDSELEARTYALARRLAEGSPIVQRYMKSNLNAALFLPLAASLDLEATNNVLCSQSNDHREAIRAFMEKRQPVFTGS